jgi:hypothetical protein
MNQLKLLINMGQKKIKHIKTEISFVKFILVLLVLSGCSINRFNKMCFETKYNKKEIQKIVLFQIYADLDTLETECNKLKKISSIECNYDYNIVELLQNINNAEADNEIKNDKFARVEVETNCSEFFYDYYFDEQLKCIYKTAHFTLESISSPKHPK